MRRWMVVLSVLAVLAGTLSGCFLTEDSPEDTLQSFAEALGRGDVDAAAGLTDDPTAARTTIKSIFDGMGPTPKLAVAADLVDDKKVTGTLDHQWRIRNGNTAYQTSVVLTETDSGWRVRWQPSVMHRQLRDGQSFSYSDDRAYLFYFVHPGVPDNKRSSMQVTELKLVDGWLTTDRDAPVYINLKP